MTEKFTYSPLPEGSFRLLVFETADDVSNDNENSGISFNLVEVSLRSDPEHDALSYTWNGEMPSVSVVCNGRNLLVTPSLLGALLILRRLRPERRIWIDGICIDQNDIADKERQVPMMSTYYSKAQNVVIWLGPADEHTHLLAEQMSDLLKRLDGMPQIHSPSDSILESYGLPKSDHSMWHIIDNVVSRTWFQRLWILQEVALAQQTVVLCGETQLQLHDLASLVDKLLNARLLTTLLRNSTNVSDGIIPVTGVMLSAKYFGLSDSSSIQLFDALTYAWFRKCTEPLDKVYGILGLVDRTIRNQIKVDYSTEAREHYWKTYVAATRIALNETPDYLDHILADACSSDRIRYLPSWCPDYNSNHRQRWFNDEHFCAGFDFPQLTSRHPNFLIPPDESTLLIRATMVDNITQVIPGTFHSITRKFHPDEVDGLRADAAENLAWIGKCMQLSLSLASGARDKMAMSKAFLRTLVADIWPYDVAGYTDLEILGRCTSIYVKGLQRFGTGISKTILEYFHETDATNSDLYHRCITQSCQGRQFFATKRGRIGIATGHLMPGDEICVIKNVKLPFVLRRAEDGRSYRLVGDAYVHGIMYGEIIKGPGPNHWASNPRDSDEQDSESDEWETVYSESEDSHLEQSSTEEGLTDRSVTVEPETEFEQSGMIEEPALGELERKRHEHGKRKPSRQLQDGRGSEEGEVGEYKAGRLEAQIRTTEELEPERRTLEQQESEGNDHEKVQHETQDFATEMDRQLKNLEAEIGWVKPTWQWITLV